MFILENIPLSTLSTMRLGGKARYMSEVNNRKDIEDANRWAKSKDIPIIIIGSGSNIIWTDLGFDGLVLINKILGYDVYEEDDENVYITIGAGEIWDDIVRQTVEKGFSGLEQLSLIPGTAGATPVQNVGAYGREIADILITVEAFDTKNEKFVTLRASDCALSYRTSRFKTTDKGRYIISAITLRVTKLSPKPPFYGALQTYFNEKKISDYTPSIIREAVIAIRSAKLPDPAKVANVGSFFHNPIIESRDAHLLVNQFEDMPHWQLENNKTKISAAWLIEKAGFKDFTDEKTGMATWPNQPLVLINKSAHSTSDVITFRTMITDAVQKKFGIVLEQEPEILGTQ